MGKYNNKHESAPKVTNTSSETSNNFRIKKGSINNILTDEKNINKKDNHN
jgi:hypothetical protein